MSGKNLAHSQKRSFWKKEISSARRATAQRGNIFFTLFGAVAIVGMLGAVIVSTIRGPLSTMVEVQHRAKAEGEMAIAAHLIMADSAQLPSDGDCDADGFVEPLEWSDAAGNGPTGGGFLPSSIASSRVDPWGTDYGYCTWDAGAVTNGMGCDLSANGTNERLNGNANPTDESYVVIAVISAGPDQIFDTTCTGGATPALTKAGDDIITEFTYAEARASADGIWNLKSGDPTVAEIDKNLEVTGGASFSGGIDLTTSSSALQLGAASMLFPNETTLPTCNAANDGLVRINTSLTPDRLELCDDPLGWLSVAGQDTWLVGTGDDIYYNTGTPQVGIGTNAPSEALHVVGNILASGDITGSDFTASGNGTFAGTLGVTGASTLTTLNATGAVNFDSTLDVDGAATLGGTLGVTGASTLTTLNATGAVDFDSTLNVDGATTLGGTLGVTGATTVTTFDATGAADLSSTLNVDGAATLNSTLNAKGTISNSTGSVAIGDDLAVTGNITATDITASGAVAAGTTISVNGDQLGPALSCNSDQKLEWNNGSGWSCVTDLQGGAGGGVPALDDLTDVAVASVNDEDCLVYDSTDSRWENTPCDSTGVFENISSVVRVRVGGGDYTTDDFVFGSPQLDDDTIAAHDSRFLFDKSKGAFRAGTSTGAYWDDANIGTASFASGLDVQASGNYSTAMGLNNLASGNYSAAIGGGNSASGIGAAALGYITNAGGDYSTALGREVTATGAASMGIGLTSTSPATDPVISGTQSLGIFMGNQSGYDLTASNRMALIGGDFMIDDAGATGAQGCIRYDGGTGKLQFSNDCTTFVDISGSNSSVFEVTGGAGTERVRTVDANAPYATSDFIFGSPQLADDGDATHDNRMLYDKSKAAFRVGAASGTQWDDVNIGTSSIGIGSDVIASGIASFATGSSTTSSGLLSSASGYQTSAAGDYSYTFGNQVGITGAGDGSVAFGLTTSSPATDPVVSGSQSYGIFMGDQSGYNLATNNRMALIGGDFMIDDAGATGSQGCMRYNGGTGKLQISNDCTTFINADGSTNGVFEVTGSAGSEVVRSVDAVAPHTTASFVFGSPQIDDDTDPNHQSKMVFNKSLGSFRAGVDDLGRWDTFNTGLGSAAFGYNTEATGQYTTAFGIYSRATGARSTAFGSFSHAGGNYSTAMGDSTTASGTTSTAMGANTAATGDYSTAIGREVNITGTGDGSMAIGLTTTSPATDPIVSGAQSFGVFMGSHSAVNFAAANTFGLFGGRMVIDPAVPATQLTARSVLDLGAATDSIVMPAGTTAQRPATAVNGMFRYDTSVGKFQGYQQGAWQDILTSASGNQTSLSSITAATQTNTIDSLNFTQVWNWSTLSTETAFGMNANALTSGTMLDLASSSTAFTGTMANLTLSGSNAANTGTVLKSSITGALSTGTPLMVTNLGAGLTARFNDGTGDADTTPVIIDASGNLAIGAATARAPLDVNGGDMIVSGTYTGTASVPATGTGSRMFFDVQSGAFRAGTVTGTQWDNGNIGPYSFAVGNNTTASGLYSSAMGESTTASNSNSTAMGGYTTASGAYSTAMGSSTTASGASSATIGNNTTASGYASIAMGRSTIASGEYSTAFGYNAVAGNGTAVSGFGDGSVAFGLIDNAVTITTRPQTRGIQSMGLFMGDQDGVVFAANSTLGLFGGNMVIDPAVPATQLTARGVIDVGAATSSIVLPNGTTAQRPGTPTGGMFRYNTTSTPADTLEYYDAEGATWRSVSASGASTVALSSITAATATNTIDSLNFAQVWNWSTLSTETAMAMNANAITSGKMLDLASSSTAFTGTMANLTLSGSNAANTGTVLKSSITGALSTGTPLMVTNLGAGLTARFNDGTGDADTTPVIIDASGNLAVGAATARGKLDVNGGDIVVTGTHFPSGTAPVTGAGTRMFFDVSYAAFRAGYVSGTQWDTPGDYSFAVGYNTIASGNYSTAMGGDTHAIGIVSTAMGSSTYANGDYSTAMGYGTTANGESSTVMGVYTTASGIGSTAMGSSTTASGDYSTAMGGTTTASGLTSTAMGETTTASGEGSTAMGAYTTASGYYSTTFGNSVVAGNGTAGSGFGDGSVAFGLIDEAVTITTKPQTRGIQSMGLFMGDQDGVVFAANSTLGLFGGNMVIDPAVPATQLTARGVIDVGAATTSIVLPRGTTAQQPASPVGGMFRYNTTSTPSDTLEYYDAETSTWKTLQNSGGTTTVALSSITAATATNTIDSLNFAQVWNWSTLSTETAMAMNANAITSGKMLDLASSSTAFTGTMANLTLSGSNAANTGTVLKSSITGALSTGTPLMVTNLGAGLTARFNDGTGDADTTPVIIDASGNLAVGRTTARGLMDVDGGDFILTGTYDGTGTAPVTGAGTRMFFDVTRAAFRAGYVTGTQWDTPGNYSTAMGYNTTASGAASFAAGFMSTASGVGSLAVGFGSTASADQAISLGLVTEATGLYSAAIGNYTDATGESSIALGKYSYASGLSSTAINFNTAASGESSLATGSTTLASGIQSTATGYFTIASGAISSTFGRNVVAGDGTAGSGFGDGSVAFGLIDNAVTITTRPQTRGIQSMGLFMGDQDGVVFAADSTLGLFGGNMVIDPAVPATQLTARGVIDVGAATSSIVLPRGTTAQRPGTPTGGMFRYNTTSTPADTLEYYDAEAAAWVTLAASGVASIPLSSITAATATNTIDSAAYAQIWNWNSLTTETAMSLGTSSMTTGTLLNLTGSNNNVSSTGTLASLNVTGTSNAAVPLMITNAGTGNTLLINDDGTTTDTTPVGVDAAGNIFAGVADATTGGSTAARLNILGQAGTGTSAAPATLRVIGGVGGTNAAGGGTGIVGGAGNGSGTGGNVSLTGGAGGATGTGGAISLTTGTGGATSGSGGTLSLTAGSAGASGSGGTVNITAGSSSTSGSGGNVNIYGGDSATITGNGAVYLEAGSFNSGVNYNNGAKLTLGAGGSLTSGSIVLESPTGHATGGGAVIIRTGNVPSGWGGSAGTIAITGGNGDLTGTGSAVTISAGNGGATNVAGSNVTINPGDGGGSGADGNIVLSNSYGNVLVGTTTSTTGAKFKVSSTNSMIIPVGTDAQRPTGAAGMFRYNTTSTPADTLEYYDAETAAWVTLASTGGASSDVFEVTGSAGSEVVRSVDAVAPHATADFLFGSAQMADAGNASEDARMFFDKSKAAFRVGTADSTQWDDANVGFSSFALGYNATASGDSSIAMGDEAVASDIGSMAIGAGSQSNGVVSLATGYYTSANADYSFTGGGSTVADGDYSFVFGREVRAAPTADSSAVFGLTTTSPATDPIVSGAESFVVFMGNHSGTTFSAAKTAAFLGGDMLVTGTFDGTGTAPVTGAGTRMFFDVTRAAFRAGGVSGTQWNSLGNYSFATGNSTTASGISSTAMGGYTTASGSYSTAMGAYTTASGTSSTAIGDSTTASGIASTAMGDSTTASGSGSTAMGMSTAATNDYSTAMGAGTIASGYASTATGNATTASGSGSTATGNATTASGDYSTAIGESTTASGMGSTAMGGVTLAAGDYSTAIGREVNITGTGDGSMAIGLTSAAVATDPIVSGAESLGIFLNDQSGMNVTASNVMAVLGGNVLINPSAPTDTTVTPLSALHVVGDIRHTGVLIDASDIRYKTDIHYLPEIKGDILARLEQIKGYSFRMKDNTDGTIEYGVIAQEVERVFPELVITDNSPEKMKSVNYIGLIAPLIEATKTLKSENEALKAKLDNMDARMAALEGDMNGLKGFTGYGVNKASIGWGAFLMLLTMSGIFIVIRRKALAK